MEPLLGIGAVTGCASTAVPVLLLLLSELVLLLHVAHRGRVFRVHTYMPSAAVQATRDNLRPVTIDL